MFDRFLEFRLKKCLKVRLLFSLSLTARLSLTCLGSTVSFAKVWDGQQQWVHQGHQNESGSESLYRTAMNYDFVSASLEEANSAKLQEPIQKSQKSFPSKDRKKWTHRRRPRKLASLQLSVQDSTHKSIQESLDISPLWSAMHSSVLQEYRLKNRDPEQAQQKWEMDSEFRSIPERLSAVLMHTVRKRVASVGISYGIHQPIERMDFAANGHKIEPESLSEPEVITKPETFVKLETPSDEFVQDSSIRLTLGHPLPATAHQSSNSQENKNAFERQINERSSTSFIEAFDPTQTMIPSAQIQVRSLSSQPILGTHLKRGWKLISTLQHGTTLVWIDEAHPENEPIPLISEEDRNGVQMLSALSGLNKVKVSAFNRAPSGIQLLSALVEIKQQPAAGIVYGKIKKGWQLRFSGRSEIPIFLDLNFKQLSESDTDQDRYFAFLNAEPGAHQMYLSSPSEDAKLSVAFPVLGNRKTYLNFTQFSKVSLSGQILEEADLEPNSYVSPQHPYRVTVLGQDEVSTFSKERGYFELHLINQVGSYPLIVESYDPEPDPNQWIEFPHRYQVVPDSDEHLTLYRISAEKLKYWVSKGPGQVSDNNGIVLAAVPGLVDRYLDSTLIPNAYSIYSSSHSSPKLFTISPKEKPFPNRPLQSYENRFIGFDLPEGPTIVEVRDEKYQMVFSELVITSPGVVSIVGPY